MRGACAGCVRGARVRYVYVGVRMRRVGVGACGVVRVGRRRRTLARNSELAPRNAWPSEGEVVPSASKRGEALRMGAKRRREEPGVRS